MAKKKNIYLVVDTETATLPFADEVAQGNADVKKGIAIAKPLVYDIGWTEMDSKGNILSKEQYLIAETFSIPAIFNTAYYKDKRPLYLEMMQKGETVVMPWDAVMERFCKALDRATYVCAYNAAFDFKKAIPFTEKYIRNLYSPSYYEWERKQRTVCEEIAQNVRVHRKNEDYDGINFTFRDKSVEIIDIWGIACDELINTVAYKKLCLELGMITASGLYFKTSAESTYRYLLKKYNFDEAHTALADAEIESQILHTFLKHKKKILKGTAVFPFRLLGTIPNFLTEENHKLDKEYYTKVMDIMDSYTEGKTTQFAKQVRNHREKISEYRDNI